jgi:hypothetical protein
MFLYENTVSVTENILIFYALKLSAHWHVYSIN